MTNNLGGLKLRKQRFILLTILETSIPTLVLIGITILGDTPIGDIIVRLDGGTVPIVLKIHIGAGAFIARFTILILTTFIVPTGVGRITETAIITRFINPSTDLMAFSEEMYQGCEPIGVTEDTKHSIELNVMPSIVVKKNP